MAKQIIGDQLNEIEFLDIISSPFTIVQELDRVKNLLVTQKISKDIVNRGVIKLVSLPNKINNMFLDYILKFKLADANATDEFGRSALNIAIYARNNEAVKVLLKHGAFRDGNEDQKNCESPLSTAITYHNHEAYDLLIKTVIKIDGKNIIDYFNVAVRCINQYVLSDLLKNYNNQLKANIDEIMILHAVSLDASILELLIELEPKEDTLEKAFMTVISANDPNNVKEIFINKKVDIKKAFSNASEIIWGPLAQKYALEINHRYSEFLKLLVSKDITIDQYKKCFYKAKEIKKNAQEGDSDIDRIMKQIFEKGGKDLISSIIKETPQTQHKDLVKWLNVFGAKFSFYNSKNMLLTSQVAGNESKNYPKDLEGNFINIKKMSKVEIKDGKLYNAYTGEIINGSEDVSFLYVMDKKGQLYINTHNYGLCHSYVLNGYNKKHSLEGISMFGYGKPAACGGHLKIKDGIITKINNSSGHYQPDLNMLIQTFHKLSIKNVLDESFMLTDYQVNPISFNEFNLDEVIASGDYLFLDY